MKSIVDLPRSRDLPENATKATLAALLYPGISYDTALPQEWVNAKTLEGWDPRPCVVWGYPSGSIFGCPLPLTAEAKQRLLLEEEK